MRILIGLVAMVASTIDLTIIVQAFAIPTPSHSHIISHHHNKYTYPQHEKQQNKFLHKFRSGGNKNNNIISTSKNKDTVGNKPGTSTSLFQSSSSSSSNNILEGKNSIKSYLIWSPKFIFRMVKSAILIYLIQKYNTKITNFFSTTPSCHSPSVTAVVLPLLSSSCCAIQLLINALSGWGCAGFNTYLGPVRPLLLTFLLFSTWTLIPHRSLGWTVLSLGLAFLPEIVDVWNRIREYQWNQGGKDGSGDILTSSSTTKIKLDVPGMGCVACINKIGSSLASCKTKETIMEGRTWLNEDGLKGGKVELTIPSDTSKEDIDKIVAEVSNAMKDAGFESSVI